MVARGVATGDYDRDGDEDLVVTENGGPVHLLRNDQAGYHALQVRLEGRSGNRDGLGAHVWAVAGSRRMQRRVRSGSSFLVASDKALTFGLGPATVVDTLRVRWPGGATEVFTGVPAGQVLYLTEGVGVTRRAPFTTSTLAMNE
jgi:hypothetical protein